MSHEGGGEEGRRPPSGAEGKGDRGGGDCSRLKSLAARRVYLPYGSNTVLCFPTYLT